MKYSKRMISVFLAGLMSVILVFPAWAAEIETEIPNDPVEMETESEAPAEPDTMVKMEEESTEPESDDPTEIEEDITEPESDDVMEIEEELSEPEPEENFEEEIVEEESTEKDELLQQKYPWVFINERTIPDSTFRSYVSENIDLDNDGLIWDDEIESVTEIDLSNETSLTSLKGIEYLVKLKKLSLYNTGVKSVDLSKNTELTYFKCYSAPITSVNISENTALKYLNVSNCPKLSSIDISNNVNLEELYVYLDNLSSLDASKNTKLKEFCCRNNPISTIDVSKNTNVWYLNVSSTSLSSLDISKNTSITDLDCSNTNIVTLDLSKQTALEDLLCNNTALTTLDTSKNTKLDRLICSNTPLTALDLSKNTALADFTANNCGTTIYPNTSYACTIASTFPSTFNVSKASGWSGGTISSDKKTLNVTNGASQITYTYNCGNSKQMKVTLKYSLMKTLSLSAYTYTYRTSNGTAVNQIPDITVYDQTGKTLSRGYDYYISITGSRSAVGSYTIKATGTGNYSGTLSKSVTIQRQKVQSSNISLSAASFAYDGTEKRPTVSVVNNQGDPMYEGTDYTIAYQSNIDPGTAAVTVTGIGNYISSVAVSYVIEPIPLTDATVSCKSSCTYDGTNQTPAVKVKSSFGETLVENFDYTVSYKNNKKVGTATIKITGIGDYTGTITKTFTIKPKPTKLTNVTASSKAFIAQWTKKTAQVTGYQIQYSTKSDFTDAKTSRIKSNETVKKTVKNLTANKKYYVRIRTYKTVDGKNYYSSWSAKKSVTTKS